MSRQIKSGFFFLLTIACADHVFAQQEIGVLTLHGVGSQRPVKEYDARLRKALTSEARDRASVEVKSVYYHVDARNRQRDLWRAYDRLEDSDDSLLDQSIARRLMLSTVGDALAYANNPATDNSDYRRAHLKVLEAVNDLQMKIGDDGVVVVVAHSLGCKVIFDYICDAQTRSGIWRDKEPPSGFQKLNRLKLLITMGCNIPFFESSVPDGEQRFFEISDEFQWLNFYDRDDLLGWPLRPLGGRFAEVVSDQERNGIGSVLTSHTGYWKDRELNAEIALRIVNLSMVNQ